MTSWRPHRSGCAVGFKMGTLVPPDPSLQRSSLGGIKTGLLPHLGRGVQHQLKCVLAARLIGEVEWGRLEQKLHLPFSRQGSNPSPAGTTPPWQVTVIIKHMFTIDERYWKTPHSEEIERDSTAAEAGRLGRVEKVRWHKDVV